MVELLEDDRVNAVRQVMSDAAGCDRMARSKQQDRGLNVELGRKHVLALTDIERLVHGIFPPRGGEPRLCHEAGSGRA